MNSTRTQYDQEELRYDSTSNISQAIREESSQLDDGCIVALDIEDDIAILIRSIYSDIMLSANQFTKEISQGGRITLTSLAFLLGE